MPGSPRLSPLEFDAVLGDRVIDRDATPGIVPPVSETVVTARGLTHDYGSVIALEDLELDVPEGVVGLVGANGAGKTTLFRILLGLLHPTKGAVTVFGDDPEQDPMGVRARVGYMPEGECLPDDRTAADFVAHTAELAGIPRKEAIRRSSETLFLVGLAEERFRHLSDFSTGMRQRVKLAQAIVHDPDVVLLDEPASGLDPEGREQMLELIRRLGNFGINVIVSSHVLTDIESTASWVVLLDGGRLMRSGPIDAGTDRDTVEVDVHGDPQALIDELDRQGVPAQLFGRRVVVGPGEDLESRIVSIAATQGLGLFAMTRTTTSLEDEFLGVR